MGKPFECKCYGEDHPNWGDCQRAKNIRVGYCQSAKGHDLTAQKRWDRELQHYRDVRSQGIEPAGTKEHLIRQAEEVSNKTGVAFKA